MKFEGGNIVSGHCVSVKRERETNSLFTDYISDSHTALVDVWLFRKAEAALPLSPRLAFHGALGDFRVSTPMNA